MKKGILKSKMMLIALASVLFVSCGGGGGGGGGGGSSNLPVKPGTSPNTPSTPSTPSVPEDSYPKINNPLDGQKGNMSALKTNLYNAQRSSGAVIPKDTSTVDGRGVKVAILDTNFVDPVRTGANSAEDDDGNSITARRNKTLTYMYESVEIVNENPNHPYIHESGKNIIPGTEKPTGSEHGEQVLEVVGDLDLAPNNHASIIGSSNKANNKIGVVLGSIGWDYQYIENGTTKKRIAGVFATQEVYEAAMARFGSQSVKIFNQSFGAKGESYDDSKYSTYKGEGNFPLTFAKMNSTDEPNYMIPYFRDAVENKGGLFVWAAGNDENKNASLEAGLPYFDNKLEKGWISVVGVSPEKAGKYNVLDKLSKAGSEAAYWSISATERGVKKVTALYTSIEIPIGSSFAAPKVTRAAALVYDKYDWMTADQIRQTLFTTTDKTELTQDPATMSEANLRNVTMFPDSTYGWGMLNEKRALKGPGAFMDISKYGDTSIFKANLPAGKTSYFDNDIYGNGGLEKLGAGTLHLTGNNSFSGGSTVTAGTLEIHQVHSSPITVGSGGTLVLNPKAIVGYNSSSFDLIGTVDPQKITDSGIKVKNYGNVKFNGNTAIIGGDYVAYNGSNTQVGFKNSVKVLGTIRIENANISILSNGYITKNETSTVMEAKSIEGNIANVETNGMRTANIEVKDGKVIATLSRQNVVDYIGEEASASSKNVAENVEKVFEDLDQKIEKGIATEREISAARTLQTMGTSTFVSATEVMSGEIYASAQALTLSQAQDVNRDLSNRFSRIDNLKDSKDDTEVWFSALGGAGKLKREGYASANTKVVGGQAGIDKRFTPTTTLGVALNYSYASADFNKYAGESKSDMVGLSLYGKQDLGKDFYLAARLGVANVSSKVERELLTATGDRVDGKINHHDKMLSTYIELGKKFSWFTPYVGISQDYLRRGSFDESNAAWGIKADKKTYRATNFLVGARAEYVADKYKLHTSVSHSINTDKRDLSYEGRFTGSNVRQKYYGVKQAKHTTWLGFGVFREINPAFGVYGNVDFRLESNKGRDSVFSTGIQYRF
ncbi:autotransporter serine protease fusolisin [Fusobacterium periodonticum]|uniref:autotransporter serine protease fusolisin n=1 Tax=Fusobacterium periodonticum TaxID=860 RepID=UPI0028D2A765|nr:autotransporter serine protease fusolisin [Fusobacterium periodonticum]